MKPLALTYGMGIGPEICLKAIQDDQRPVLLLGRREPLDEARALFGLDYELPHVQYHFCEDQEQAAEVEAIKTAVELCRNGRCSGMVTGPINKASLVERGFEFHGHTEFLGHLCGDVETVMAFSGGELQVILATTHIPLKDVSKAITIEGLVKKIDIADRYWKRYLNPKPKFTVCGLNPHAGESGVLGREEIDVIAPACEILRGKGIDLIGPVSAETAFLQAKRNEIDIVVAMYHDQGLAPLKLWDFGRSVNWTLGLPIIRTSVDHGTADSLVGKGIASADSLLAAMDLAQRMVQHYSNGVQSSTVEKSSQISSPQYRQSDKVPSGS